MIHEIFADRQDAAWRLAERFKGIPLRRPLVLAIPRGGVEIGAVLARSLGAELDVVLSRKLSAPDQPELAVGAVSESGEVYLNSHADAVTEFGHERIERERRFQLAEIERRKKVFRGARPAAPIADRSVIVTDDGIATGSTMVAALRTIRGAAPRELIVAVPVASSERLNEVAGCCDRTVCLHVPEVFWAVGQFYRDFDEVSDERVCQLLSESRPEQTASQKTA